MVMVALGLTTRLARLGEVGGGRRLIGVGIVGLVLSSSAHLRPAGTALGDQDGAAPVVGRRRHARQRRRPTVLVGRLRQMPRPGARGRDGEVTLYSDLLLHDMGPALDDKIVQGDASGVEWRTTPLVGVSLRQRYLHDGRATTLRDAILAHGGEGQIVRDRFFALGEVDRQAMLAFVGMR